MTSSSKESTSYRTMLGVALIPILLGLAASFKLTFQCCNGLAMVPAPGLGYVRWDIAYALYLAAAVIMCVVSLLIAFLCNHKNTPQFKIPILILAYAILIHQVETKWGLELGKYLSTMDWGYDPHMTTPQDVPWVTSEMERQLKGDGQDHVETSLEPILTPEECREFVAFALQHADDWMNSHKAIPLTLYAAFGGDINYGRSKPKKFQPYQPSWCPSWFLPFLPRWNYYYGFERYMGRESAATNQTFHRHVQQVYRNGLGPYLEKIRNSLARHLDISAKQIVLGGDDGTVIWDFSPPSVIVGLPNAIRQWGNNYHRDTIPWGTKIIKQRLQQEREEDTEENDDGDDDEEEEEDDAEEGPCAGGEFVHAGTLALEIPRDGAGMLWWLVSDNEDWIELFTPYHLGYIATLPGTVRHSIAPYQYTGWFDTRRITLQMFMLECVDKDDSSTWYVFH